VISLRFSLSFPVFFPEAIREECASLVPAFMHNFLNRTQRNSILLLRTQEIKMNLDGAEGRKSFKAFLRTLFKFWKQHFVLLASMLLCASLVFVLLASMLLCASLVFVLLASMLLCASLVFVLLASMLLCASLVLSFYEYIAEWNCWVLIVVLTNQKPTLGFWFWQER
jgi:hypothetical protein